MRALSARLTRGRLRSLTSGRARLRPIHRHGAGAGERRGEPTRLCVSSLCVSSLCDRRPFVHVYLDRSRRLQKPATQAGAVQLVRDLARQAEHDVVAVASCTHAQEQAHRVNPVQGVRPGPSGDVVGSDQRLPGSDQSCRLETLETAWICLARILPYRGAASRWRLPSRHRAVNAPMHTALTCSPPAGGCPYASAIG
jgi:hypothetical protein